MRIKDYLLNHKLILKHKTPYVPAIVVNPYFAGKKVQTTYKEYKAVEDENNTVHLGKFIRNSTVRPEHIAYFINECIDMIRMIYRGDCSLDKKRQETPFDKKLDEFYDFFYDFQDYGSFVTTYNEKGFVTSYEISEIFITFKYNKNNQLIEWKVTVSGETPCTRQFLYNKNDQFSKVLDILLSGDIKEWIYNEKGDMVAIIETGDIIKEYKYLYNSKGAVAGITFYFRSYIEKETLQYDENGNIVQSNFYSSNDRNKELNGGIVLVFINSYKKNILTQQEILHYSSGDKELLLFDEQGRITQKQCFEYKYLQGFMLIETIYYKYFDNKVEIIRIEEKDEKVKSSIICKDIEYQKEPYYDDILEEESNKVPYNENIFSCIEYDLEENEKNKLIRNYSPNGEWETIFYHNGTLSHIVRKECTIVEN